MVKSRYSTAQPIFDLPQELAWAEQAATAFGARLESYAGDWEISPPEVLAREACHGLLGHVTVALREHGAKLTEDVMAYDPATTTPKYLGMYADTWLELRELDGLAQVMLGMQLEEVKILDSPWGKWKPGQTLTRAHVESLKEREIKLAWRLWQMRVRSGEQITEWQWFEGLAAAMKAQPQMRVHDLHWKLFVEPQERAEKAEKEAAQ